MDAHAGPCRDACRHYLVGDIQVAVGLTEGHHNRHVAIFAGHVEGGVAVPVLEVDRTSLADESLDDLHLTPSHGKMKSDVSILVGGIKVGSVFRQTLHDVVVAPGRGCQEGRLSFSVLNVHIAAGFAKGFGHRVVAVPGGTVQGGFFLLAKETHA